MMRIQALCCVHDRLERAGSIFGNSPRKDRIHIWQLASKGPDSAGEFPNMDGELPLISRAGNYFLVDQQLLPTSSCCHEPPLMHYWRIVVPAAAAAPAAAPAAAAPGAATPVDRPPIAPPAEALGTGTAAGRRAAAAFVSSTARMAGVIWARDLGS